MELTEGSNDKQQYGRNNIAIVTHHIVIDGGLFFIIALCLRSSFYKYTMNCQQHFGEKYVLKKVPVKPGHSKEFNGGFRLTGRGISSFHQPRLP